MNNNSGVTQVILVRGVRISENLEHHKASDVLRILEEKGFVKGDAGEDITAEPGFAEAAGDNTSSVQCYVSKDGADNGSRTVILLGEGDFVLKENGVKFYERG